MIVYGLFTGWILIRVLHLELNINMFNPLRASSYIPTPKTIMDKKAVINVRNNDDGCFGWALASALITPEGPPNMQSSYPHYSSLFRFDNINFPVSLKDIQLFENLNHISVNVYTIDNVKKMMVRP